ncbi:MAG TPA: MFS transporter [Marmoricola sp.]|nr:MFS transporter [Marmoricola sp.]
MKQAFRQPGFRRLFAALSTSMFGDSVMLLVLSMWVKQITGSNGAAGLTFFWMVIPAVFAPAYGMYLDRLRRRPTLVWGNLLSAVAVLPLLLVHDAGDVWIVYTVAFLYGISFVVLPAALNGLLKEMLPEHLLVDANSSIQTVKEGYRLIGPLIGAGLFGWLGGGAVAVVDAVSFALAALIIASIPLKERRPERSDEHWWAEMSGGVRHLVREPLLKHLLVSFGLTILVLGFTEASIYALLDFYDKPVTFAGVLVSIQGVGAIAGGLTTSWWVRRIGEPACVAAGLAALALGAGAVGLTSSLSVVAVAFLVVGYALPMLFVAFMTLLQRRTPQRLMGRASAAVETLMGAPQAISLAVGAGLVAVLDFHVIFGIVGLVTAIGAAYLVVALRSRLGQPVPAIEEPAGQPAEAAGPVTDPKVDGLGPALP